MSDLQRSFLKGKLSRLPPVPPFPSNEDEEERAEAESGDSFSGAGPSMPPASSSNPQSKRRAQRRTEDYAPRTAEGYFEQALEVDVPLQKGSASFRVYFTPPRPKAADAPNANANPSATASIASIDIDVQASALPTLDRKIGLPGDEDEEHLADAASPSASKNPGTMFVFHHGAGFSALSFALTAAELTRQSGGEVGVLSYDCRGHGRTKLHNGEGGPLDMSIDTLSSDLTSLLSTLYPHVEDMPSLILVGHSMGGSVVVSAAHALAANGFTRISGVAVLDVVEGTAMDALEVMRSVVLGHPSGFASVQDAIRWHVDSKTIANAESARISVPPLIEPNPLFSASAHSTDAHDADEPQEILDEAGETDKASNAPAYKWRADLLATEPYWRGWFEGLSSRFLSVRSARLLLLAGTDRLDRELMIGQMQGKYQLEVIADVGHSLHEDAPDRTARILFDFWRRNERIRLPLKHIKKVGES